MRTRRKEGTRLKKGKKGEYINDTHVYNQPLPLSFPLPLSLSLSRLDIRVAWRSGKRSESTKRRREGKEERRIKRRRRGGIEKSVDKVWIFGFSVVLPEGCVAIGRQRGSDGSRSVIGAPPSLSTPVGRCLIKRDVKWGRSIKARPSDKFDSPDSRLIPRRIAGGWRGAKIKPRVFQEGLVSRRMTDRGRERPFLPPPPVRRSARLVVLRRSPRTGERKSGDMQTSCRETVGHNSATRTAHTRSHH